MHPAAVPIDVLLAECDVVATRRGGPGGQRRNKVQTAVVIRHRPTGIVAEASERRSQADNRRMAMRRLRLSLALGVRLPPCPAASSIWADRVRAGRIAVASGHDDYPTVVAEALDQLAASGGRLAEAAGHLGITTSQLVGLFRKSSVAWQAVNESRRQAGQPALA
ncbi:MAG: peptide chain release factor family protein [Planctomycetaceae bacterium]